MKYAPRALNKRARGGLQDDLRRSAEQEAMNLKAANEQSKLKTSEVRIRIERDSEENRSEQDPDQCLILDRPNGDYETNAGDIGGDREEEEENLTPEEMGVVVGDLVQEMWDAAAFQLQRHQGQGKQN